MPHLKHYNHAQTKYQQSNRISAEVDIARKVSYTKNKSFLFFIKNLRLWKNLY